jgi:hypothetical protein
VNSKGLEPKGFFMSKPKAPPPDPYLEAQKRKAEEEEKAREAAEREHRREEKFARTGGKRGAQSLLSGTFLGFPEGGTGVGTSQAAPVAAPPAKRPTKEKAKGRGDPFGLFSNDPSGVFGGKGPF